MKNKKRLLNYINKLELLYHLDFSEDKKAIKEDIININNYTFKSFKNNFKKVVILYGLRSETEVHDINLQDFLSCFGGIDLIKLDARLFNLLIDRVKNLHNLSGVKKLKIYCNNEKLFKKIYRLL